MITSKVCIACGKILPAANFNGSSKTTDGLARTCRTCVNTRRRKRYQSKRKPVSRQTRSTVIRTALRNGDVERIQKLLTDGAVPHWDWICETMREGHVNLAETLLQSGVKRNVFTMAAMGDVKRLARRLKRVPTEARFTVDMEPASGRVTPLHVACASDWTSHGQSRIRDQTRTAMTLSEYGADLNAISRFRGIDEVTPLLCACWTSRNPVLVRWLLDHGAPITETCLPAALGHFQRHGRGSCEIAEMLLSLGLDIDCEVGSGRTLLQAFAHQGDHRTVAWLIAHGANVNACGAHGRMAVHYAAERNSGPKTLAILIEAGANLLAEDVEGRTPLEIAKFNEKTRLVEWITRQIHTNPR